MKIDLAVWTAVNGYEWQPGSVYSQKELNDYKNEIGSLVPDTLPLGGLFLKEDRVVFYRVQIAERMDVHGRDAIYCVLGTVPQDRAKEIDFSVVFNSPAMAQPQKPVPTAMECTEGMQEFKSPLGDRALDEKRITGSETFSELGGWCEEAKGGNLNVRITGSINAPLFTVKYKPCIKPVREWPSSQLLSQAQLGGCGDAPKPQFDIQPKRQIANNLNTRLFKYVGMAAIIIASMITVMIFVMRGDSKWANVSKEPTPKNDSYVTSENHKENECVSPEGNERNLENRIPGEHAVKRSTNLLKQSVESVNLSNPEVDEMSGSFQPKTPVPVVEKERNTRVPTLPGDVWDEGTDASKWKEGQPYPKNPNLVSGEQPDTWVSTRPGYVWEEGTDELKWTPGLPHSKWPHVISAVEEGMWYPDAGYVWKDGEAMEKGYWTVVWKPGLKHPRNGHLESDEQEGEWKSTLPGYLWVKGSDELKWTSGLKHPILSHVVSAAKEGYWIPESGYRWARDPRTTDNWAVEEMPEMPEWWFVCVTVSTTEVSKRTTTRKHEKTQVSIQVEGNRVCPYCNGLGSYCVKQPGGLVGRQCSQCSGRGVIAE